MIKDTRLLPYDTSSSRLVLMFLPPKAANFRKRIYFFFIYVRSNPLADYKLSKNCY